MLVLGLMNWLPDAGAQFQMYDAAKGRYLGLVYTPNEDAHAGSTFLDLEVHSGGSVSGRLVMGGKGRRVNGTVLPDGQTTLVLYRGDKNGDNSDSGENDWDVKGNAWLQFDMSGQSGLVWGWLLKDPSFTFSGELVRYGRSRPAPQAGKYTVIIPGAADASGPGGSSAVTLDASREGKVKLNMFLADGRQQKQQTGITGVNQLPVFLALYEGDGSLMGQWEIGEDGSHVTGIAVWTRPGAHAPAAYPDGWVLAAPVKSSRYVAPPKGSNILGFSQGTIRFSGGDLTSTLEFAFELSGVKASSASSGLSLKFTPSTGLFTGSFAHPSTGKKVPFKGAVLQNENCGYGYFLTAEKQSGQVYLGAAD